MLISVEYRRQRFVGMLGNVADSAEGRFVKIQVDAITPIPSSGTAWADNYAIVILVSFSVILFVRVH